MIIIAADQLPTIGQEIYAQLAADVDTIKTPEHVVTLIAAQDILVREVTDLAVSYGIDVADIPLKMFDGHRLIGPARRFQPVHLRWLLADLLDVNPDLAGRLTRIIRNASIYSGSIQTLGILADEHDRAEKAKYQADLAALAAWTPHDKEAV